MQEEERVEENLEGLMYDYYARSRRLDEANDDRIERAGTRAQRLIAKVTHMSIT